MSIRIRQAIKKDAIWIVKCINRNVELSKCLQTGDVFNPYDQYFIAEFDSEKAGVIAIDACSGEIKHLAVDCKYRRRGIASKLIQYSIERLKSNATSEIWAQVRVCNTASLECFKKNGFRTACEWPSRYDPNVRLYKLVLGGVCS